MDSYSLQEASELLGISPRVLHRRIQEGAFPGRFLAPGRHGLETRIPAEELERAVEEQRRRGQVGWRPAPEGGSASGSGVRRDRALARSTITPAKELDSVVTPELVPSSPSSSSGGNNASGVTHTDLESLRDAMLAIVREDREMFLAAVRDALMVRDREIVALRQELTGMRKAVDGVRAGLEGLERRLAEKRAIAAQTIDAQMWTELVEGSASLVERGGVDLDALLREIGELESLLAATHADS